MYRLMWTESYRLSLRSRPGKCSSNVVNIHFYFGFVAQISETGSRKVVGSLLHFFTFYGCAAGFFGISAVSTWKHPRHPSSGLQFEVFRFSTNFRTSRSLCQKQKKPAEKHTKHKNTKTNKTQKPTKHKNQQNTKTKAFEKTIV